MARTARKEAEEVSDVIAPDFDKAIRIIRQDVRPAEDSSATERGKLSGAWKAVEKECHCNRPAAKLFAKLMGMNDEARDDFLRTQYGMMRAAKIGITRDLVDIADGVTEQTMPVEEADGSIRGFTAGDAEFEAAGLRVPGVGGFTGDNLPDELKASAEAGKAKKPRAAPKLVTVN